MTDILSRKFACSPDAFESAVGNETVILHAVNGTYYGLDPVGTRIWALINQGLSSQQLCQTLAEEYGVALATIEDDVRDFLTSLEEQGIIVDA
jgi:hypothetical protein